jgi:N-acetylglucosaminyldiphosphoundecaprenol N-acetyl-beta-D-mannosaminyltransferase
MAEAVAHILEIVRHADRPAYVCTGNLDHLALLQHDAEFKRVYEGASLVLADGMPVLWLSRLGMRQRNGLRLRERVAGSDLFWELGRASAEAGLRLFFLGGAPGAADAAATALQNRYPGARVCNTYCPPKETFDSPEEQERIFSLVRAAAPDVLLVGFGAPKQEKWIAANRGRLSVPVSIGVGGSFDLAAGFYQRAPEWMQRSGLEWAYRLIQDPGRLARRYLGRDLPCLIRLAAQAVTDRSGTSDADSSSVALDGR